MLTVREAMALRLAGEFYKYEAARHAAVKDQLGLSAVAWRQMVNVLLDRADALAEEPQLVLRLRRVRERRALARGGSIPG